LINPQEHNKLIEAIDEHEIISFDIFDTLLLREVLNPTDIFDVVEQYDKLVGFKEKRIKAENKARIISDEEDVSLNEIYKYMDVSEKYEIDRELEFLVKNKYMHEIFKYAQEKNKRIIIITDMYLPQEIINKMLLINDYFDYEALFVSNEVGKTKASGSMYSYVKDSLNIDVTKWLHIGDNNTSDCKNANSNGISSYYYKALREKIHIKKDYSLAYSVMKALQINYLCSIEHDYWHGFGVLNVSSLMWGFTSWLTTKITQTNIKEFYFLSRDGYLPFRVYEQIQKKKTGLPKGSYLLASRRAYQFPNIINMGKEEAVKVLTAFNPALGQNLTIGEVLNNIGLEFEFYKMQLKSYGFNDSKDVLKGFKEQYKAQDFLLEIYDDVVDKLSVERDLVVEYLVSKEVLENESINVVDIGWRGSTQNSIQDLLNVNTYGYYFGSSDDIHENIRQNVDGYYFDCGLPKKNSNEVIDNIMMYEFIFSSPESSLLYFKREEGEIIPVFSDKHSNAKLNEIQNKISVGVLAIVQENIKKAKYFESLSSEDAVYDYKFFIQDRKYEDLKAFSEISAFVGIGDGDQLQKYVSVISGREYRKNKRLYSKQFSKNMWKDAALIICNQNDFGLYRNNTFHKYYKKVAFVVKHRIIKGILNPRRSIKYILKKIVRSNN